MFYHAWHWSKVWGGWVLVFKPILVFSLAKDAALNQEVGGLYGGGRKCSGMNGKINCRV